MNIWIIKDGEPMPGFDKTARLMRAWHLGDCLAKAGYYVTWWASTWSHYKKKKYINQDHCYHVNPNFEIRMLNTVGYRKNISINRIIHYSNLARKFSKEVRGLPKPSLIISALPAVELSFAAVNYAQKIACPVLIDFRDMWPDLLVEIFPKLLRPFARLATHYQFAMMKSLCQRASGFIGISEPYLVWAAQYAKREINDNDTVLPLVSPHFNNTNIVGNPLLEQFFRQRGINFQGKFNVVFAGSYAKKAVDLKPLIETFKNLPQHYQLLIAGSSLGDKKVQRKYEKLKQQAPNVYLLGWLNSHQLDYLYRHSHLAVAPYLNKKCFKMNLTNKPIEYLYYGLPILTSVKGYLSNLLLENQIGYYYDNANINEITAIIKKLAHDKALLQAMSKRSKTLYEKKYQYNKVMNDFISYLKDKFSI